MRLPLESRLIIRVPPTRAAARLVRARSALRACTRLTYASTDALAVAAPRYAARRMMPVSPATGSCRVPSGGVLRSLIGRFGVLLCTGTYPRARPTSRLTSLLLLVAIPVVRAHVLLPGRSSVAPVFNLRGGGLAMRVTTSLPQAYMHALASAPYATKFASAAVIAATADALAQSLTTSASKPTWDWARTRWMLVWGAVFSGLANSLWFDLLSRCFPNARTRTAELAMKVAVNQLVMAPALNVAFFTFVIWTRMTPVARMNRDKWAAFRTKCSADLLPTTQRGTVFWTCAQTLNFKVLPARFTVLSTNIFALIWTIYLSVVGNRKLQN